MLTNDEYNEAMKLLARLAELLRNADGDNKQGVSQTEAARQQAEAARQQAEAARQQAESTIPSLSKARQHWHDTSRPLDEIGK
jgi:hypothetical protein